MLLRIELLRAGRAAVSWSYPACAARLGAVSSDPAGPLKGDSSGPGRPPKGGVCPAYAARLGAVSSDPAARSRGTLRGVAARPRAVFSRPCRLSGWAFILRPAPGRWEKEDGSQGTRSGKAKRRLPFTPTAFLPDWTRAALGGSDQGRRPRPGP